MTFGLPIVLALLAAAPLDKTEETQWNEAYSYAERYFNANDFARARDEYRRLLGLATSDADRVPVRFMLARCDEMSGDSEAAARTFAELAHQTIDSDTAAAAAAKLKVLDTKLGQVNVACTYLYAPVTLSGRETEPQTCPATFTRVSPGHRKVVLRARFAREIEVDVEVVAGQPIVVAMPEPALLELRTEPTSATTFVESEPVVETAPVQVAPGAYHVLARAPDHRDAERDIKVKAGASLRLNLALEPNSAPQQEPATKGPWPWLVTGTGGAIVATGFAFLYLNRKNDDNYERAQKIGDTDPERFRDAASQYQVLTIAAYIAGGVTASVGIAWLLWPSQDRSPRAVTLTPTPSGLVLDGIF